MEVVSSAFVEFLLALLAAVMTVLGGYAAALVRSKLKFVSEAFAQEIARSGIALAEEAAAVYVKKFGQKMASSDKLDKALAFVLDKLPGISEEEAITLIKAELPKVGLGAAGFLSAVAAAARTPEVAQ